MNKRKNLHKQILRIMLALALITSVNCVGITQIRAGNLKNTKFNKIEILVGKTATVKIKNPRAKVKWSVGNKKIAKIKKKSGNKKNIIVIKGLKAGKTKITAKCGGKKYNVNITVKKKIKVKENDEIVTKEVVSIKPAEEITTKNTETITPEKEITTASEEIITETAEESKEIAVKGRVLNNQLSVNDMLQIIFTVTEKDVDEIITYSSMPETLEILEDGQWTQMVHKKDADLTDLKMGRLGSGECLLFFTPMRYYENIRKGHYRYTHEIEGNRVTVEFEIGDKEDLSSKVIVGEEPDMIIGTVKNDKLSVGEDLIINYAVHGKEAWDLTSYNIYPAKLEIYEDEQWKALEMNYENVDTSDIDHVVCGSIPFEIVVSLDKLYFNIRPGHYRYTDKIGKYDITLEFDIVA